MDPRFMMMLQCGRVLVDAQSRPPLPRTQQVIRAPMWPRLRRRRIWSGAPGGCGGRAIRQLSV